MSQQHFVSRRTWAVKAQFVVVKSETGNNRLRNAFRSKHTAQNRSMYFVAQKMHSYMETVARHLHLSSGASKQGTRTPEQIREDLMATMPAPVGMGLCGCADSQRNSCRFCKEIPSYKRFDDFLSLALPEPGLRTAERYKGKFHHNIVQEADVIAKNDPQGKQWAGLELATRIRPERELSSGACELYHLLKCLRELGSDTTADCTVAITMGTQNGMRLRLAKRVVVMVALLENRFFRGVMMPASRENSNLALPIVSNSLFSDPSFRNTLFNRFGFHPTEQDWKHARDDMRRYLGRDVLAQHGGPPFENFLTSVWIAPNLTVLAEGLRCIGDGRCGLSLKLHADPDTTQIEGSKTSYFQFDWSHGSLSHGYICHWVDLCHRLIGLAELGSSRFAMVIERINIANQIPLADKAHYTVRAMRALEVPHVTIESWRRYLIRY